jgi:DnaK suppressor protein
MSKVDVNKMKKRILTEKERLEGERDRLREGGGAAAEVGELGDYDANHPGDAATELFERGKDMALDSVLQGQLVQIDEALARIEAGTYGTCERCGNAIPAARLEALPQATLCIDCQARAENSQ